MNKKRTGSDDIDMVEVAVPFDREKAGNRCQS